MRREIDDVRDFLQSVLGPPGTPRKGYLEMRALFDAGAQMRPMPEGWTTTPVTLGRPAEALTGPESRNDAVILYLHGGGYVLGSPLSHRGLAAHLGQQSKAKVMVLDYRLAPEHPFPAAIEDAVAAYRALLAQGVSAKQIVIAGDSAGGGLTMATALSLRDAGDPLPAGLFLISPWVDLTQSGDSYASKADRDPIISKDGLDLNAAQYLNGADATNPLASPLMADLSGLPPILIQVGTEEALLSDSEVLQARADQAGVAAALEIWPTMIHVWHAFYPMLASAHDAFESAGIWIQKRI